MIRFRFREKNRCGEIKPSNKIQLDFYVTEYLHRSRQQQKCLLCNTTRSLFLNGDADDAASMKCFPTINKNDWYPHDLWTNPLIHNFPCIFITSQHHNRKNGQPFGVRYTRHYGERWAHGSDNNGNCVHSSFAFTFLLLTINNTLFIGPKNSASATSQQITQCGWNMPLLVSSIYHFSGPLTCEHMMFSCVCGKITS